MIQNIIKSILSSDRLKSRAFLGFLMLLIIGLSALSISANKAEEKRQAAIIDSTSTEKEESANEKSSEKLPTTNTKTTQTAKVAATTAAKTTDTSSAALLALKAENDKKLNELKSDNQKALAEAAKKNTEELNKLKAAQTKELEELTKRQTASMLKDSEKEKEITALKQTQTKELEKAEKNYATLIKDLETQSEKKLKTVAEENKKSLATLEKEVASLTKENKNLLARAAEKVSSAVTSVINSDTAAASSKTSAKAVRCNTEYKININPKSAADSGLTTECDGDLESLSTLEASAANSGLFMGGSLGCIGGGIIGAKAGATGGIVSGAFAGGIGAIPGGVLGGAAGFFVGCTTGMSTGAGAGYLVGKFIDSPTAKRFGNFVSQVWAAIPKITKALFSSLAVDKSTNPPQPATIKENTKLATRAVATNNFPSQTNEAPINPVIKTGSLPASTESTQTDPDKIINFGPNQLMLISIGITDDPRAINSDFSIFQFENPHDYPIDSRNFGISFEFVPYPDMPESFKEVSQEDYVVEPHTRSRPFIFLEGYWGNENFN